MLATLTSWLGLNQASAKQALLLAASAWLAFAIAASLHVENAYWAAMPVWVVAQPLRGMLLERALFRVLGTLLGALTGFVILTLTSSTQQLIGLAASVAGFSALTHILRGSTAYGALMAGITTAVVAIPSLLAPQDNWTLAYARVECTLIGVLTTTLILGVFTPRAPRNTLYWKARQLAADAIELSASYVEGSAAPCRELAILRTLNEIDTHARPMSAGSLVGLKRLRHIDELLLSSLSLMAAAQALAAGLRPEPEAAGRQAKRLRLLAQRLRMDDPLRSQLTTPRQSPRSLPPKRHARLEEALRLLWQSAIELTEEPKDRIAPRASPTLLPYRDWRLASRTGLISGLGTLLCAWAVASYPGQASELAATGVCIFSMILGSLKQPQKQAPHLLLGVAAGVAVATIYRLVLQPQVSGLLDLIVGLFPFILFGALLHSSSRFGLPAVDANMCFLLASQAGMPAAGTIEVMTGSGALLVGALSVGVGFLLFPRRPEESLKLMARAISRDLAKLLQGHAWSRERWLARCGRTILLLMSNAQTVGSAPPQGLLALLNLGQAIIDLHELSRDPRHSAIASEALSALGDFAGAPHATAQFLQALSRGTSERWLIASLQNAAQALLASAGLLQSSGPHRL